MKYGAWFIIGSIILISVAVAAAAEAPTSADGFIYGVVSTRSGNTYSGVIRWGSEESFWDDIFHSAKESLPYAKLAGDDDERREDRGEEWWEAFGRKMKVVWGSESKSRVFAARFGDIEEIRVTGGDSAAMVMRSGAKIDVSGYANDVDATLTVLDQSLGRVEVPWRKIDTISFGPTPSDATLPGRRLYGTVRTDAGEFTGFVQWDSQECLDVDELDGDQEDGRVSIAMGKIQSIERRSRRSSKVVLRDGRELILDGTNDVNSSIRGILVEDPRYGRVKIPWDAFDRVDFSETVSTGRGYRDYGAGHALAGTVVTRSGERHKGRLVFDLDEAWSWEMLNGSSFDIEYSIPFDRVAVIEPRGSSAAMVTLVGGEEIRLEGGQDVTERNDGMAIIGAEEEQSYVPWREVERIELTH